MKILLKTILLFLIISFETSYGQNSSLTILPFLPDIISQFPAVRDLAISPQENEMYFTAQSYQGELSALVYCTNKNGVWSKPEIAPFSGRYQDLEPFFTPDGLRLFFVSNRPVAPKETAAKDFDIWIVERKDLKSQWSNPINIGEPVNTEGNEFYPSLTKSNTLYFTSDGIKSTGKDDIFTSKFVNGKYETPLPVGDSVNSDGYEFNAFIAPDESFLLYTCYNKKGGYGSGDLYISYNKGDGHWSAPTNLGNQINSQMMDYCPFVNVNSGIMYFTSKRSMVQKQFDKNLSTKEFLKEVNRYENGLSRVYQVNIKNLIRK